MSQAPPASQPMSQPAPSLARRVVGVVAAHPAIAIAVIATLTLLVIWLYLSKNGIWPFNSGVLGAKPGAKPGAADPETDHLINSINSAGPPVAALGGK